MSLNFLNHQTKRTGSAAVILAVSYLISRVLGVARDWLLAKNFGAGQELDIYFAAFKIPDLVYNIFILGGVVAAFLPLFSEYYSKEKEKTWDFVSNFLNVFLFFLVCFSLIIFVFAPVLTKLILPGFNPEQLSKTVFLTRLMLLSPIFFGISSIFSGILQYFNRFLIYSFAPIIYNLSIIFGILFFSKSFGILGVAVGVVLGALMHFLIQIPAAINSGFQYRPIFNLKDKKIKKTFLLMGPRIFGVSSLQINAIIINAIASTLAIGSISVFNFANNIRLFPIAIIGISLATAVFPKLSKSWTSNDKRVFIDNFSSAFRQIVYLIIPISILIFFLRNQIVGLILKHGQFSDQAAKLVAASIGLFCFGTLFATLRPLFFRAFFSIKDTKTPTILALIFVILNIWLSLFLIKALQMPSYQNLHGFLVNKFSLHGISDISVLAFPLAYLVSLSLEFSLFIIFLKKRIGDFRIKEILSSFYKIILAGFLMIVLISFVFSNFESFFANQTMKFMIYQIVVIGLVGSLAYLFITNILGSPEIKSVKSLISDKFLSRIHNYEQY